MMKNAQNTCEAAFFIIFHENSMMVFLYTYYYKWRGVHLVKDDEENIGHMDEQYVELALLPGFVRGRNWTFVIIFDAILCFFHVFSYFFN